MTTATRPASRTPPRGLMRGLVNPVVRTVLRSPAGRWCGPLLLLEVTGRRTGRRRRIPVVGHARAGRVYALTDAPWAANFTGGAPVVVTRRGRRIPARGVLLPPAGESAAVVRQVIATEGPRALGLVLPAGRAPTDEELCRLRRVVLLEGLEWR